MGKRQKGIEDFRLAIFGGVLWFMTHSRRNRNSIYKPQGCNLAQRPHAAKQVNLVELVYKPQGCKPGGAEKAMELGNPTVISEKTGPNLQHTLTIKRIRQWRPDGKVKIWFADPYRGSWSGEWNSTIGNASFNDGSFLFYLNK